MLASGGFLVSGVTLKQLPLLEEERGSLSFGEVMRHVPFEVRRYYVIFGVPEGQGRGDHAHRATHQFNVCVRGSCHIAADDGTNRAEFVLDTPATALYVAPMVWTREFRFSPDAVLLVLASSYYDPADYLRDRSEFLAIKART